MFKVFNGTSNLTLEWEREKRERALRGEFLFVSKLDLRSNRGRKLSRMAEVETAAAPEASRLDEAVKDAGLEEGEIAQTEQPSSETKKHPLEHAWTFWFDNYNSKQKQATWGSSLRPVYTFQTVEDFWWYVTLPSSCLKITLCGCVLPDFGNLEVYVSQCRLGF